MEMAQLALQADLASEGKQVIDKGIASGALGSGAQAERAKRLKALVDKKLAEDAASRADEERQAAAAKDGDGLVSVGMKLVYSGQAAKGVQLMQQGIAKGGLKRPEDAKLHLGIAQLVAGDKAKAQATLQDRAGQRRHRRPGAPLGAVRAARRGVAAPRLAPLTGRSLTARPLPPRGSGRRSPASAVAIAAPISARGGSRRRGGSLRRSASRS